MKIVVLAGGLSNERNVSLSSGVMVAEALRARGHQVALTDLFFGLEDYEGTLESCYQAPIPQHWKRVDPKAPDLALIRASRKDQSRSQFGPRVLELCRTADIVYLALHGDCGENGSLQAAFDLLGIAYTGSGSFPSAIAMDKDLTKRLIADTGVKTPAWRKVVYQKWNIPALCDETRLPVVVKPLDSGSSIGVSIAHTRQELERALEECLNYGGRVVLEQYIQGREIQMAWLCGRTLPSIEIIPKEGFYDYENKYQPGATVEITPAPIPPEWEAAIAKATDTVFRTLGLAVYSRADFILTEDGTPWFLEINTLPGMTPTSLVPQEAAAVGIDYGRLCEMIIEESLKAREG
ncbi:MAG: D-alanine--D-alanine ligase [Oscillospiraceae bacterium]|nr:D-alanine--D-alanine ligase [Oscillospiraceae bacterium]